ncbi:Binding-protein-dependent transport systems inner membrane component [Trichormus variabilis ATCC 29413]|uniref:Binding-protein-dependent transport systems inner membrane component n=2 Tax=Anabaena variabilis TaxID=264691 RepID=Q3MHA7_TRIV2|nr:MULTISPECIES: ABC transporter permease subunit [Nostocaceae]ABA19629.1 Binding-protein-dependent transport systems inner membrane component [Trichormus variabilis ATCC 29413]MBC1216847.1 ABC transporter permease [Trichormus variabilis ARAD]MBC1256284.1 ABC transporter permease [Trichormus variabilis V5]MBC1269569.1 ABC transporter permease [Trichormus variabilis FSR]MBC1305052.1 ABC transporter permease [Trichormus variabilis N2B]
MLKRWLNLTSTIPEISIKNTIAGQESLTQEAWRKFCGNRQAMLGAVVLLIIVLSVVFGPLIYSVPINKIDFAKSTLPPSWEHPFGTNDLGQDILARILYGGRISIAVGVFSMVVAITLGILIGALSGFYGGWLDVVLMRLTDLCLALPRLPLLLLVIFLFRDAIKAIAGPELGIFVLVVLVIGGLNWMSVARLVRAGFLTVREQEFVTAARALGASPRRLIWIHILPNVISPVLVAATLSVSTAIVTESTLSFFGLGFPPDVPTWGRMLYDAQNFLEFAPYMVVFPGTAIFLTVLSINYIGDGLRDALDPRLS